MTDLTSLTTYSEWLDSQGLVVSDQGPDADKRTHSDLAAEFLAGCPMSDPTPQPDPAVAGRVTVISWEEHKRLCAIAVAREHHRMAARTADAAARLAAARLAAAVEALDFRSAAETCVKTTLTREAWAALGWGGQSRAIDRVEAVLRAALSATAPDAGRPFNPDHCTACGDLLPCGESWIAPDGGQREVSCDDCGHLASRHWLPGGCHGTQGSIARACRCARNSP